MVRSDRIASGAAIINVAPARLRSTYGLLVLLVGIAGAWIWFGNAGVAMAALLAVVRPPWHAESVFLITLPAKIVMLEPWRMALSNESARVEVFRDEVSATDWNLLRRHARTDNLQHLS